MIDVFKELLLMFPLTAEAKQKEHFDFLFSLSH